MKEDLQRLAETAAAIERQARELRERIDALAAAGDHAANDQEPATDDSEARLVAYSMVLDGRPREEVARHLEQELGFVDSGPLLDDLYARA